MLRTLPPLDALYIPIGLGSGICGAILVRDLLALSTEIIGVQASGADCYVRSFAAGHVVATHRAETEADGIAVRQPDPAALEIILRGAARIVSISDVAIADAVRTYWTDTHNLIEGAGAAPLAAMLAERERMRGKRVGLVASGGNIDLPLFHRWVLA
jgi:threonine dehydratase